MAASPAAAEWREAATTSRFLCVCVCVWVGLRATQIIRLSYVVILNYVNVKRQHIIKAANMVENCIKLRQDKVDYVLD